MSVISYQLDAFTSVPRPQLIQDSFIFRSDKLEKANSGKLKNYSNPQWELAE